MYSYLVFVDAVRNSNKFWSAKVEGSQVTVEWGRVGYKSQTKVHDCNSDSAAVKKFYNLVSEKKMKGYTESQSQMDGSRSVFEIRQALQLLNVIRPYVVQRNFDHNYISALNEYLKIVLTPLGMQIEPSSVYRTVADVDHQRELLNSLLPATPQPAAVIIATSEVTVEPKVVSLKAISKSFWRHL